MMLTYWVYIMASRSRVLYTGVTNDLGRRVHEHKEGVTTGFTQKYRINRLVYFEEFTDIRDAIGREKQIKGWVRSRKIKLIEERDLHSEAKDLRISPRFLDADAKRLTPSRFQRSATEFLLLLRNTEDETPHKR